MRVVISVIILALRPSSSPPPGVEERHAVSLQLQEERGCDSGRAGADDGDAARRNDATRREPTDMGPMVGHY